MKPPLFLLSSMLLLTLVFFPGCREMPDDFQGIRDYLFNKIGADYKTNLEISLDADNVQLLRPFFDNLRISIDEYSALENIRKIEFGVYHADHNFMNELRDEIKDSAKSMIKRLKRSGYRVTLQEEDNDKITVIFHRPGKYDGMYIIHLGERNIMIARLEGIFDSIPH